MTSERRRLLSIQLSIAYLNDISQSPHWRLIFTARKTKGRKTSKETEKKVAIKSQDPVLSAPQSLLLNLEEPPTTRRVSDSVDNTVCD